MKSQVRPCAQMRLGPAGAKSYNRYVHLFPAFLQHCLEDVDVFKLNNNKFLYTGLSKSLGALFLFQNCPITRLFDIFSPFRCLRKKMLGIRLQQNNKPMQMALF